MDDALDCNLNLLAAAEGSISPCGTSDAGSRLSIRRSGPDVDLYDLDTIIGLVSYVNIYA